MAIVIKPPAVITPQGFQGRASVALFGSIEQGVAIDWQTKAIELLKEHDIDIYNPRRSHWDSSWKQASDNPQFTFQVDWELTTLENVGVKLFYFDPSTKSPITLMELGLAASYGSLDTVVCCPKGFWRKGNVDIVCKRYGIHQEPTLEDAIFDVVSRLNAYHDVKRQEIKPIVEPTAAVVDILEE